MNFNNYLKLQHSTEQKQPTKIHKEVYLNDQHMENKIKKKILTKEINTCIVIDSRHRDRDKFPNTNNFRVTFDSNFSLDAKINSNIKNIIEIRLLSGIFPIVALDHAYIQIKIEELHNNHLFTSDGGVDDIFAIMTMDKTNNTTSFVSAHPINRCSNTFNTPISNLNGFTISFLDPNGNLIDFGNDNVGGLVNDSRQTMLVFGIKHCIEYHDFNTELI
jgi:hypothetical protein